MAFLPQELASAEERFYGGEILTETLNLRSVELTGVLKLPSNDAVPLVKLQRKIAVALDPLGVIYAYAGKKLCVIVEIINLQGYMAVSDVGRMAMGSSRSELPL